MPDKQEKPKQKFFDAANRNKLGNGQTPGFGKMPPQAIDMEEAVLGALMLDTETIVDVLDILQPDAFYVQAHKDIYKAIQTLFDRSAPIDILTVGDQLKKDGKMESVGGAFYVSELTNKVASSANAEHHARVIAEKYILRNLIQVSSVISKDAYEDTTDVFDLLDQAEQDLYKIAESNLNRSFHSMSHLVQKTLKEIESLKDKEDGVTGVPTGFRALDGATGGWQKSDLIILASRPGMGKTSFTLTMARNAAVLYKKAVAVFTLEMSGSQLVTRLISAETQISSDKLRKGTLQQHEWVQLTTQVSALSEAPLFIDDTPGINIFELRAKCRRLKRQHNVELIVIDYLQLMSASQGDGSKGSNREQEISQISRALKKMAMELETPVIALSQLNRSVETRGGDKRPLLSDLRESGAIEQDADLVMFIYRPDYYQIYEDENGHNLKGLAELILAKHRNGATGTVNLRFVHQFAQFANWDGGEIPESVGFDDLHDDHNSTVTMGSKMNSEYDDDIPFL